MEREIFFSEISILVIGAPVTLLTWIVFGGIQKLSRRRLFRRIQRNLSTIEQMWDHNQGCLVYLPAPLFASCQPIGSENSSQSDRLKSEMFWAEWIYLLIGILFSFFSWFGFLMSVPLMVVLYRNKSRTERSLLVSKLNVEEQISQEEIIACLIELGIEISNH